MKIRPRMSCVALVGLIGCLLCGCSQGLPLPDDLPPLSPCVIHVQHNAAPVGDATVTLIPSDGKWVGVGLTDPQGKAIIKTQGRYPGIPADTYTVTITKYEAQAEIPPTASTPEEDAQLGQSANKMPPRKALVPEKYLSAESSDLKLTVTENAVDETFNLQGS